MPKVGEGMCAGIEFLPHREINLIGLFVARSEILEFRCLIQHVCDARSCPGTKSGIGVVDITKWLQAVERRIYPAVDGKIRRSSRGLVAVVYPLYTHPLFIDTAPL